MSQVSTQNDATVAVFQELVDLGAKSSQAHARVIQFLKGDSPFGLEVTGAYSPTDRFLAFLAEIREMDKVL